MLEVDIKKKLPFFTLEGQLRVDNEIVVLWGASGAGKTTILKIIAGLLTADEGRIQLEDRLLYDSATSCLLPPRSRNIGFVFQNFALFPHLSVGKNLTYSRRADKEEMAKWLEVFGIAHLVHRYPQELSGGEQQRVALARALLSYPRLLLLDEPFSSLDKNIKEVLRQELKSLQRLWQIPFIVVTHDEDDAHFLADRTYCVEQGRVSEA